MNSSYLTGLAVSTKPGAIHTDAGEAPKSEGAEDDTADLKAALLEQASEVLTPDDTDLGAQAAIKAHLDSHLEVVRIAA